MPQARHGELRSGRQRLTTYISRHRPADLGTLRRLTGTGEVTPVAGETYPLAEAPQAIRHLAAGGARGKTAITIRAGSSR